MSIPLSVCITTFSLVCDSKTDGLRAGGLDSALFIDDGYLVIVDAHTGSAFDLWMSIVKSINGFRGLESNLNDDKLLFFLGVLMSTQLFAIFRFDDGRRFDEAPIPKHKFCGWNFKNQHLMSIHLVLIYFYDNTYGF